MKPPSYHYRVLDCRVLDGDTVELTTDVGFRISLRQIFRLARINAPELSTPEGKAARDMLYAKLHGATLSVESVKTEKYGRWLAELWADGVNVNDWLLTEGLARPYGLAHVDGGGEMSETFDTDTEFAALTSSRARVKRLQALANAVAPLVAEWRPMPKFADDVWQKRQDVVLAFDALEPKP